MISPRHLVGAAAAALLATSVVGLLTRDESTVAPAEPGEVVIASFEFRPATVTVPVGTEVTWVNTDDTAHTVDSTDEGPLDSGDIELDGTFAMAFDAPGTYDYLCALHPFMKGTVEVTG